MPDACWALRRGYRHPSNEYDGSVNCTHVDESARESLLCLPLIAQGETLGTLHLIAVGAAREAVDRMAGSTAEQLGLALANLRLRDDLRQQAIRDPLTSLFNRRFLLESLTQSLHRCQRQRSSTAVVMLDLDHFKRFNDTFGHDAGDHVLKCFAHKMRQSVRASDIACRYGGEEFCIIFPDTTPEQALTLAYKLCELARALELRYQSKALGSVTVSVGLAMYPQHGSSAEALLKAADDALYQAKAGGRDQVVTKAVAMDSNVLLVDSDAPSCRGAGHFSSVTSQQGRARTSSSEQPPAET